MKLQGTHRLVHAEHQSMLMKCFGLHEQYFMSLFRDQSWKLRQEMYRHENTRHVDDVLILSAVRCIFITKYIKMGTEGQNHEIALRCSSV